MGPNQTYKICTAKKTIHTHTHTHTHTKQKTTYGMGENCFKQCNQQGLNLQNIQIMHTTQQKEKKLMGRRPE